MEPSELGTPAPTLRLPLEQTCCSPGRQVGGCGMQALPQTQYPLPSATGLQMVASRDRENIKFNHSGSVPVVQAIRNQNPSVLNELYTKATAKQTHTHTHEFRRARLTARASQTSPRSLHKSLLKLVASKHEGKHAWGPVVR